MVKPPLRTKSIGFKVSEEEYAQAGGSDLLWKCSAGFLNASREEKEGAPLLAVFEKGAAPTADTMCLYTAGGRIFIFRTVQSFTITGPRSPKT